MQCQLCLEDQKLIKAHVIPEGFFRLLRVDEQPPQMLTNTPGRFPKRAPIGVYDKNILCADCEALFGAWDAYAQKLLLTEFDEASYLSHRGQRIALRIAEFDYEVLKLFFVSLLWRATVSTCEFYSRVRTGPFEQILKERLLARDPGPPDEFAVSLAKFEHPAGQGILDPHPERWSGVNYMRFYLGGYVAYIKVDRRPPPELPGALRLSPQQPLLVVLRNLEASREFPLIRQVLYTAEQMRRR